jgi:hypothetical protein
VGRRTSLPEIDIVLQIFSTFDGDLPESLA